MPKRKSTADDSKFFPLFFFFTISVHFRLLAVPHFRSDGLPVTPVIRHPKRQSLLSRQRRRRRRSRRHVSLRWVDCARLCRFLIQSFVTWHAIRKTFGFYNTLRTLLFDSKAVSDHTLFERIFQTLNICTRLLFLCHTASNCVTSHFGL